MKQAKRTIRGILITILLLTICAILVPKPKASVLDTPEFTGLLVTSIWQAVLYVGAAVLFLQGLKGFKAVLHKAYRLICAGLMVFALVYFSLPFMHVLNLFESSWFRGGLIGYVFSGGLALALIGLCAFAKGLGSLSRWTNPWFLIGVIGLLAVAAGFTTTRMTFSTGFMATFAATAFGLADMLLALHIKRRSGAAYTYAMAWLVIAFFIAAISGVLSAIHFYFDLEQGSYQIIPSLLSGISVIKAGYAFNKVKEY